MKPLLQKIGVQTVIGTCISNVYLTGRFLSLTKTKEEYILKIRFESPQQTKSILREYLSLGTRIKSHSNVDVEFIFPLSTTPSITIISL